MFVLSFYENKYKFKLYFNQKVIFADSREILLLYVGSRKP